ncbi:MAG: hypothetical protein JOY78_20135 [Pseudonocardia sp.]|nr:hypothetical protein [Pseudonocardia sp.]
MSATGPLATRYLEYCEAMERLVSSAQSPDDWAPLAEYVAVNEFERTGVFCEVQNWQQYIEMLTRWGGSVERFETTVLRATELDHLLYYEVEERHRRGEDVHLLKSMSVVEFNDADKIRRLSIYLQQARH